MKIDAAKEEEVMGHRCSQRIDMGTAYTTFPLLIPQFRQSRFVNQAVLLEGHCLMKILVFEPSQSISNK